MATGCSSEDEYEQVEDKVVLHPCIDSSDFATISQLPIFIDKTMLIRKILIYPHPYILITAPPGFGKSTNLNMLKRFVEVNINKFTGQIGSEQDSINYLLFKESLLISRERSTIDTYLGKFAVIYISLGTVYGSSMKKLMEAYGCVLCLTFCEHIYLLNSDKLTDEDKRKLFKYTSIELCPKLPKRKLETGISFLVHLISKHYENYKIFAFIDEYDWPLLQLIKDPNISNKYERQVCVFFRNIFRNMLSVDCNINRALITGVTTLGKNLFRSEPFIKICNFSYENCDHPFGEYYGVSIKEIDALLNKIFPNNEKASFKLLLDSIYYSSLGYVSLKLKKIISIRALMNCFNGNSVSNFIECVTELAFVNISLILPNLSIRYQIEKILQHPWPTRHSMTFKSSSITSLRNVWINRKNWSDEAVCAYLRLLADIGILNLTKPTINSTSITVANDCTEKGLLLFIDDFYSSELNDQLNFGAVHLNSLSIGSGNDYFSKFAEILQHIYKNPSDPDDTANDASIPFINIVGKSEYFLFSEASIPAPGICIYNQATGIICVIDNKFDIKKILRMALTNSLLERMLWLENRIFMAINFDESFSFSFGLIVNSKDMNNAVYYNF